MKNGFKRGLSVLVVFLLIISLIPVGVMAESGSDSLNDQEAERQTESEGYEGDYYYWDYEDGVKIGIYSGNERNLRIPSTLAGKKVVAIHAGCFRYNETLEIVTIPDSVTTILGSPQTFQGAFSDCVNLKTVDLGEGLIDLGGGTFSGCKNLTTVLFGNKLKKIGAYAFRNNEKLTLTGLPESVTEIGNFAFEACHAIKEMEIPAGVSQLSEGSFYRCKGLETITLPEGLKSIGYLAFAHCESLKSASIPDSVEWIADSIFDWCTSLDQVEVGSGLTEISEKAFAYCLNLNKAFIGENIKTIHRRAFEGSSKVSIYGVPGSYAETFARQQWLPFIEWPARDLQVDDFTTNKEPDQRVNTEIVLAANGLGGQAPYTYKFYYQFGDTVTTIQDFSAGDQVAFKPLEAGTYTLFVEVKDSLGNTATKSIKDFHIVEEVEKTPVVRYQTHIQDKAWQDFVSNGEISGTSGQALRLEGIKIELDQGDSDLGLNYRTHVEKKGWQDFKVSGEMSGTEGQSLRLEAIEISLSGADAKMFDIYYQTHVENYGWLDWAKNGEKSGTEGYAYRLEAIKILLVPQGETPPDSQSDHDAFYSNLPQ